MTLDELKVGESAVISAVGGEGALRCRLLDMGLTPRTRVTMQKIAPMGFSMPSPAPISMWATSPA